MSRKRKGITLYDLIAHLATKRDLQALERKTEAGFEQLVVTLASVVKLMQKQQRVAMRRAAIRRRRAA
jgi:hypothetical protein